MEAWLGGLIFKTFLFSFSFPDCVFFWMTPAYTTPMSMSCELCSPIKDVYSLLSSSLSHLPRARGLANLIRLRGAPSQRQRQTRYRNDTPCMHVSSQARTRRLGCRCSHPTGAAAHSHLAWSERGSHDGAESAAATTARSPPGPGAESLASHMMHAVTCDTGRWSKPTDLHSHPPRPRSRPAAALG